MSAPYAEAMQLQVPPELEEWFRHEVRTGQAAAREGRLIDHEDVIARIDQKPAGRPHL